MRAPFIMSLSWQGSDGQDIKLEWLIKAALANISEPLTVDMIYGTEYPELIPHINKVSQEVSSSWVNLTIEIPEEVRNDIIPEPQHQPEPEAVFSKPVRGIKLVQREDGTYVLLVHKKDLNKPLSGLVLAFKNALQRFGIEVASICTAVEDLKGPEVPREIHPQLMNWITWLSNPSSIDWKKFDIDLTPITRFITEVVLHGRQPYCQLKGVPSRTGLYINCIINTICKLFLMDRKKWIDAFWHYIPSLRRERKNLEYHSLKKFETVLVKAERDQMPTDWNTIQELQEKLLESYLDLSGTYIEYKLRRTSDAVVKLLGKPLLKVLYDRIRVRNDLISRSRKRVTVKLSDVLTEGVRRNMYSCLPYSPICALHRRNFFKEMAQISRLPQTFDGTVEGLPFDCKTMRDYARYCIKNKDLSPPKEEDSKIESLDTDELSG